jgi:hypothetical protein
LEIGVGTLFYNIIKNMYAASKSCIKVNNEITDYFETKLGVKQGDNFSPNLFKIFINDLPKYLQETPDFVSLNGRPVHCLMYANDVILLSKTAAGLQSKIDILNHYCEDWCLNVNTSKTKILVFNKAGMVFCLVQNFFSDNTKVRIFIFFVAQALIFFPEFNIRLYDKNSESDYLFFSSTKIRIFFSATLGIRIFF